MPSIMPRNTKLYVTSVFEDINNRDTDSLTLSFVANAGESVLVAFMYRIVEDPIAIEGWEILADDSYLDSNTSTAEILQHCTVYHKVMDYSGKHFVTLFNSGHIERIAGILYTFNTGVTFSASIPFTTVESGSQSFSSQGSSYPTITFSHQILQQNNTEALWTCSPSPTILTQHDNSAHLDKNPRLCSVYCRDASSSSYSMEPDSEGNKWQFICLNATPIFYTAATDADYNSASRMVECLLEVHFDGASEIMPCTVTKDNYLITCNLLEEVSSDNSAPFSTVSANELSFELVNLNDIFSPANASSPYAGKIALGVQIDAYIRPITTTTHLWDPIGIFYLTDWQVGFAGQTVAATATDKVSSIINAARVKLPVYKNIQYNTFIQHFFTKLGMPIILDSALIGQLRFGYHVLQNADFLNNIAGGLQLFIFCDHEGNLTTRLMHKSVALAHIVTDNDQLVEPTTKQSILLQYDGASVCAKIPQLSNVTTLYTLSDIDNTTDTRYPPTATGSDVENSLTFSNIPVVNVAYTLATGDAYPTIHGLKHNATELEFWLHDSFRGRLEVCGQYIQTTDVYAEDTDCKNSLKFSSIYIQTQTYLNAFKRYMDAYVSNALPIMELTVKGNPRFQLGEKICVQSTHYGLNFTGILIRQELRFDGGLSGTLTLLNASILEGV